MDGKVSFAKQPARIVLVDFSGTCDITTIRNIQQTLEQFFCLICSMYGSPRVPFLGLFALGNCPEVLFPLQHVKGNFPRLQAAFKELLTFHEESDSLRHQAQSMGDTSSVIQGVVEATNMFKKQAQSLLQISGCSVQLELMLLTTRNTLSVSKQVEKALQQLSVENIKKVQVVSVTDPEKFSILDDVSGSQTGSTSDTSSHGSQTAGMVDHMCIENDLLSLDSYFRSWLHDTTTDREHLHLILPPSDQGESNCVIKCDLHERLLNPELTQFGNCYSIHSDIHKPLSSTTSSKSQPGNIPVYKLKVIKKLPAEGLCESVVFGLPSIVKATSCWKIDWDELERNERHFQALSHLLQTQKEILVAALEDEAVAKGTNQRNFRYQVPVPRPSGHFVLLPSHSNALLLKSVVVKEFLLPCDFLPNSETPTDSSLDNMKCSLSKLEISELYNPLLADSGLYSTLTHRLTKNVPGSSTVGKRKASGTAPSKPQSYNTKPSVSSTGLAGAAPLTFTSASSVYQNSRWRPGSAGDASTHPPGSNKFL